MTIVYPVKVVLDSSSLLSLVRYYIPFDNEQVLFDFVKSKLLVGALLDDPKYHRPPNNLPGTGKDQKTKELAVSFQLSAFSF